MEPGRLHLRSPNQKPIKTMYVLHHQYKIIYPIPQPDVKPDFVPMWFPYYAVSLKLCLIVAIMELNLKYAINFIVIGCILTANFCGCGGTPGDDNNEPALTNDDHQNQTGSETLLRTFLISMTNSDAETLYSVSVARDDLDILLESEKQPAYATKAALALFSSLEIQRLKIGDTINLPGNHSIVLDQRHINDDRLQLTFESNPFPFDMVLDDGKWKVNPVALIAVRKASKTMRENGAGNN